MMTMMVMTMTQMMMMMHAPLGHQMKSQVSMAAKSLCAKR